MTPIHTHTLNHALTKVCVYIKKNQNYLNKISFHSHVFFSQIFRICNKSRSKPVAAAGFFFPHASSGDTGHRLGLNCVCSSSVDVVRYSHDHTVSAASRWGLVLLIQMPRAFTCPAACMLIMWVYREAPPHPPYSCFTHCTWTQECPVIFKCLIIWTTWKKNPLIFLSPEIKKKPHYNFLGLKVKNGSFLTFFSFTNTDFDIIIHQTIHIYLYHRVYYKLTKQLKQWLSFVLQGPDQTEMMDTPLPSRIIIIPSFIPAAAAVTSSDQQGVLKQFIHRSENHK